ncbi:MAG: DUF3376 domain-containing protein [Elainellaceae cyanobacterium]
MPTPRRNIALVIAGGGSLGSYEAGVLTELLYALDYLNRTRQPDEPEFVVDVITGGSAGALTAALVARIMLHDYGERSRLYEAWVERIDIVELMREAPNNAILSKGVIRKLAQELILDGIRDRAGDKKAASFSPQTLRMSLSLSNMNGIDYALPMLSSAMATGLPFVTTLFSDTAQFELTDRTAQNPDLWTSIIEAAIASSTFPIAFQPEAVPRSPADYPDSLLSQLPSQFFPPQGTRPMAFLDGGIFNNEPLQEAIKLSREIDGGIPNPDRLFLLIDPAINVSNFEPAIDIEAPLENHIRRLIGMIYSQGQAIDWLRQAYRKNTEIAWRDELVEGITYLVRTSDIDADPQFVQGLQQLAQRVIREKRRLAEEDDPKPALAELLQTVKDRFPEEYASLGATSRGAEKQLVFLNLVFILNTVASLENKSVLQFAVIGSTPARTAGDQISGFGGFFNKEWRQHDYRQGRIEAHNRLAEILTARYPKEQVDGRTSDDYRIEQDFSNVTLKDADRKLRLTIRRTILDRLAKVVRNTLKVPLSGWVVTQLILRRRVDELLEL